MRRLTLLRLPLKKTMSLLCCLFFLLALPACVRYWDLFLQRSYSFQYSFWSSSFTTSLSVKSTCNTAPEKVNMTLCPGCLRPRVSQLGNLLKEVGYQEHLIRDSPPEFFKPAPEALEQLVTDYLIVPRLECPYLLVVQPSVLDKPNERDVVRNTWGNVAREHKWPNRTINAKVKIVFIVGNKVQTGNISTEVTGYASQIAPGNQFKEIKLEADLHNDILYLDMIDSYRNLTLKLLSAFKWVKDNCPCVKFVLKVDSDTFVNVPLLVDTLLYFEDRLKFSILGMIYMSTSLVMRGGIWAVPTSLYPMTSFPEYASGCGYVISYAAMSKMVDTVPYFRLIHVEDAFITGVMRRVIGCKMFTMYQMLTHYLDKSWNYCQMLEDTKILGMSKNGQNHALIWESFQKGSCP